jgi:hypothetical protein
MSIAPALLVVFMPVTTFAFFIVGGYYDLREYIAERQRSLDKGERDAGQGGRSGD